MLQLNEIYYMFKNIINTDSYVILNNLKMRFKNHLSWESFILKLN